ncbi:MULTISPECIES: CYTH domain-containing protein [unclassified Cyanobium]|uniref:CYTH domain-containing protein n=1 Tax=unclassified Cyanobium TaxID=2627006 RepID=UPI0020CF117B|nr:MULTISPECIES: CYTH domain-containing protein [unclassified Cyanobium]MCP9833851.1 CYTH domain-containing protein [Cyanobium sp. La Preciosa 7G6]MCP9936615.1 CYTH domain-containing protein [Cyanobium sp. Aljojuca 7A6]
MALEIERRFLVSGDQWRSHALRARAIRQGYLATGNGELTLRVRLAQAPEGAMEAFLTLKLPAVGAAPPLAGQALTRQEYEYPIPAADAEALLEGSAHQLCKTRYGLDLPGGDWVLDVFEAANAPLVVAEVELEQADQAVPVPAWCSREITGRTDLSNAALAHRPLASWPAAERESLLPQDS